MNRRELSEAARLVATGLLLVCAEEAGAAFPDRVAAIAKVAPPGAEASRWLTDVRDLGKQVGDLIEGLCHAEQA